MRWDYETVPRCQILPLHLAHVSCEIEKIWFHSITTEMCCQVIFITDSLQYFHFYQLPTTAWDGMPAVSTVVRASHGHKLNWENCWRFYELMLRHLMAHFRAYLKISLKLLSVRSGTSLSFPRFLFLLGIAQHSSHIVSQDTVFVSRCQIPVSQQVSEIPSFQTSIGFLCTFFSLAKSFLKGHRMRLCLIMCPSKIFQHISAVKPCWACFLKS